MQTFRLTSTDLCYTPGIVRWAQQGASHKRDRPKLLRVFTEGYGLPRAAARKLIDGDCLIDDATGVVTVEI